MVVNPDGLDVEHLLRHRDRFGGLDREHLRPGDELLPPEAWLDVPAEVLVPAAISYCVDSDNQAKIGAKLIVEAANMPVTADADELLAAHGIRVLPVRPRMRDLVTAMFERATLDGLSLRAAALQLSEQNLEAIQARFGNESTP